MTIARAFLAVDVAALLIVLSFAGHGGPLTHVGPVLASQAQTAPAFPKHIPKTWQIPDIEQAPIGCIGGWSGNPVKCTDWDVCMVNDPNAPGGDPSVCVTSGPIAAVRLRITTSEQNVGDGPLLVFGQRDTTDSLMSVHQGFEVGNHGWIPSSYKQAQLKGTGFLYYDNNHHHWHYLGFEGFGIRSVGRAPAVNLRDHKTGVCLGDRYRTANADSLPHHVNDDNKFSDFRLHLWLQRNDCHRLDPSASGVEEGLSVGQGDDYRYNIDYQYLDITSLPSGTYEVWATANPARTLLEKNYTNDSSSALFTIQWPSGAARAPSPIVSPPAVRMIKSCPYVLHCAVATNLQLPKISGKAVVGATLHGSDGRWGGQPDRLTLQWLLNGRPIPHANKAHYKLTAADAGHLIALRVTAFTPWGATVATSRPRRVQ